MADKRVRVDWEAVERDYRVGQLTVRQVAEKHGCSVAGLMKKAKKDSWTRDLTDAVRIATKAKVRERVVERVKEEVEQSRTESRTKVEQATFSEIDLAANVNATIILGQQKRVGQLSGLFSKMVGELEVVTVEPVALDEIVSLIKEESPAAAEAIGRLRSLTARMNNMRTASDVLKNLNSEERRAFNIDEEGEKKTTIEDLIEAIEREDQEAGK